MAEVLLGDDIREAFAGALMGRKPVLVATASASGEPDIAFKGSVMVWDADHVAFWERAHGQTLRNLRENGRACLLYQDFETRTGWKLSGTVELLEDGELRQRIMDKTIQLELDRDPERKGVAVLIRVDRVMSRGEVIMRRE